MCCCDLGVLLHKCRPQLREWRCLWLWSVICLPVTGPLFIVADLFFLYVVSVGLFITTPFILATCCCCCFCGETKVVKQVAWAWLAWLALVLAPLVIVLAIALYPAVVAAALCLFCWVSKGGGDDSV